MRRHTLEDRSELISCIENGNYAKAARIAAGKLGYPSFLVGILEYNGWGGKVSQSLVLVAWD